MEPLEGRLHVREVGDDVHEQDHVERAAGGGEHRGVGEVALEEAQRRVRVASAGGVDRGRRDVDADAVRRLQAGEQVAGAAAEVEDAQALGHAHPQDPLEVRVVVGVPAPGALDLLVAALVEAPDLVEDRVGG